MTDELSLIHGDCIEEMATMPENSIDLTVTSPPYDNLRTYKGSLQWNEGIWKDILKGLYRVTKPGGVVVWVVGDATIKGSETGTSFKQALYAMECGFNLHDTMIYEKAGTGACGSNYAYWQAFEYMFVFSKGCPTAVNRIELDKPCVGGGSRIKKDGSQKHEKRNLEGKKQKLNNIWRFAVGGERNVKHPAKFPEKLAHDHVVSWSDEGDVVFDPFMGSGTTGKMALQLGRKFVGVEKVEEYFKIASDRIFDSAL
jgi:site-specific DNA-methyltransferase (adenine-specific)